MPVSAAEFPERHGYGILILVLIGLRQSVPLLADGLLHDALATVVKS
jgi:hypothetical protein